MSEALPDLRILHVGKFFPPIPGGMERALSMMVCDGAQHGLKQMALVHHPSKSEHFEYEGAAIHTVRCIGEIGFAPIALGFAHRLRQLLKAHKPDVIHLHLPNVSAFAVLLLPVARKSKWVIHWHAEVPHDAKQKMVRWLHPVYRFMERRLLARASTIITTSQTYLETSQSLEKHRNKCTVVALGIEQRTGEPQVHSNQSTPIKLLTVGRLSYYKGMDVLIRALANAPEATLTIVGDGDQRETLLKLTETLNLGERVRFLGRVDDGALLAEYAQCDVFCLPSIERSEAFGLVLLEAMREGKPVLASNLPGSGMIEVVEDGVTGQLIEPGNPKAWAEAIVSMSSQPVQRTQMGLASRTRFETHYTANTMRERLAALYRALCDEG